MAVKDTVLSVLQNVQSADGFISGQELAEKCGISQDRLNELALSVNAEQAGKRRLLWVICSVVVGH